MIFLFQWINRTECGIKVEEGANEWILIYLRLSC